MIESEDIQIVEQPRNLTINLYKHQLASIYQMENLEKEKRVVCDNFIYDTTIGINADISGYGKTLSMIGLIVRNKMEWDMTELYYREHIKSYSCGRIISKRYDEFYRFDTTLIVTNKLIINQWYDDLNKYTNLNVAIVKTKRIAETIDPGNYDIVLVIDTMYNILILRHSNYIWKRFIFDEPGHIKIKSMQSIMAGFTWLVSATPNRIGVERKRGYISEILDGFTDYSPFTNKFKFCIIKNDDDFVKKSFIMPKTTNIYHNCYNPLYKNIKGLVNDNILEMISAGNISGVIKSLGGNETSNIVDLIKQKKYQDILYIQIKIDINIQINNTEKIAKWIKRKDIVLKQIEELEDRFNNTLENQCIICYNKLVNPIMEPKCQNIFCGNCLLKWLSLNTSCPCCRSIINLNELIYIVSNSNKNESKLNNIITKQQKIIDLINSKINGKFIIFSSFDDSFNLIRNVLKSHNISFIEVKGKSSNFNVIKDFKEGNTQVIFLNSIYNGTGINLQETTDIILYHKMSEEITTQIIGRANRIGRISELTVHHLISD